MWFDFLQHFYWTKYVSCLLVSILELIVDPVLCYLSIQCVYSWYFQYIIKSLKAINMPTFSKSSKPILNSHIYWLFQNVFWIVLYCNNILKNNNNNVNQVYSTLQVQRCYWWGWLGLCHWEHKDFFLTDWLELPSHHQHSEQCNSQSYLCWLWPTVLVL